MPDDLFTKHVLVDNDLGDLGTCRLTLTVAPDHDPHGCLHDLDIRASHIAYGDDPVDALDQLEATLGTLIRELTAARNTVRAEKTERARPERQREYADASRMKRLY